MVSRWLVVGLWVLASSCGGTKRTTADDPEADAGEATVSGSGELVIEVVGADVLGTDIPADGRSRVPIEVRSATGELATGDVVLSMNRAGGRFEPATVSLTPDGASTLFIPCDDDDDGCEGPLTLNATLADDDEVVGSTDVEIVSPSSAVGWPTACLGDEIVIQLDGNNWILDATETITQGRFHGAAYAGPDAAGPVTSVGFHVVPADLLQGAYWDLGFSTGSDELPLEVGVYEMTTFAGGQGLPTMEVYGDARSCTPTGRFELIRLETAPHPCDNGPCSPLVTDAVVSFEQYCVDDGVPPEDELLSGCVHFVNHKLDPAWCPDLAPPGAGDALVATSPEIEMSVRGSDELGLDLPADGHTRVPVVLHRTGGSIEPISVALSSSRGAGRFEPATVELGDDDAVVAYVPCDSCDPDCTGEVTLAVADVGATGEVLGTIDVTLVDPAHVGWPQECLTATNTFHLYSPFDGVFDGDLEVETGDWTHTSANDRVSVTVDPADVEAMGPWHTRFRSAGAAALVAGVYDDALAFGDGDPAFPGLEVLREGSGCKETTGRFEVLDIATDGEDLSSVTVAFEQHCGDPDLAGVSVPEWEEGWFQGCVRYTAP